MEIKNLPSFCAVCLTVETNFAGMLKYVRYTAQDLYKDAAQNNLEVTGPLYWNYYGMDGNPETIFTLEIALPVTKPDVAYKGNFAIKTIKGGKFACMVHNGPWEQLPQTYGQLIPQLFQHNLSMNGYSREIYVNMDFLNSQNQITEVQIGIND